jgi:hypothetical protein
MIRLRPPSDISTTHGERVVICRLHIIKDSVSSNAGSESTRDIKPDKRRKQSGFHMSFRRIVNLELLDYLRPLWDVPDAHPVWIIL